MTTPDPDPGTTAETWLGRFAQEIGATALSPEDIDVILDLAGIAAHSSERKAAPVACWLAASAGLSPRDALNAAERLRES